MCGVWKWLSYVSVLMSWTCPMFKLLNRLSWFWRLETYHIRNLSLVVCQETNRTKNGDPRSGKGGPRRGLKGVSKRPHVGRIGLRKKSFNHSWNLGKIQEMVWPVSGKTSVKWNPLLAFGCHDIARFFGTIPLLILAIAHIRTQYPRSSSSWNLQNPFAIYNFCSQQVYLGNRWNERNEYISWVLPMDQCERGFQGNHHSSTC